GAIVAIYLFASGAGGFLGGPAADRFGPRTVIAWSLLLSAPFLLAAPLMSGWPFVLVLAIGGFFLQSARPVNVVFGQALAPVSAATVSSLMMGFAWGMGGFSVPLVGAIADRAGIERTLFGIAFVPLAAAAVAMLLPRRGPSACCLRGTIKVWTFGDGAPSPPRLDRVLVRPGSRDTGGARTALGQLRYIFRLAFLQSADGLSRARSSAGRRTPLDLAARDLHVPARAYADARVVQHAHPVDVRGRARAVVADQVLRQVLHGHRRRR